MNTPTSSEPMLAATAPMAAAVAAKSHGGFQLAPKYTAAILLRESGKAPTANGVEAKQIQKQMDGWSPGLGAFTPATRQKSDAIERAEGT